MDLSWFGYALASPDTCILDFSTEALQGHESNAPPPMMSRIPARAGRVTLSLVEPLCFLRLVHSCVLLTSVPHL
jgi:hypothetical protein